MSMEWKVIQRMNEVITKLSIVEEKGAHIFCHILWIEHQLSTSTYITLNSHNNPVRYYILLTCWWVRKLRLNVNKLLSTTQLVRERAENQMQIHIIFRIIWICLSVLASYFHHESIWKYIPLTTTPNSKIWKHVPTFGVTNFMICLNCNRNNMSM
jgi:hypothetical protein